MTPAQFIFLYHPVANQMISGILDAQHAASQRYTASGHGGSIPTDRCIQMQDEEEAKRNAQREREGLSVCLRRDSWRHRASEVEKEALPFTTREPPVTSGQSGLLLLQQSLVGSARVRVSGQTGQKGFPMTVFVLFL